MKAAILASMVWGVKHSRLCIEICEPYFPPAKITSKDINAQGNKPCLSVNKLSGRLATELDLLNQSLYATQQISVEKQPFSGSFLFHRREKNRKLTAAACQLGKSQGPAEVLYEHLLPPPDTTPVR